MATGSTYLLQPLSRSFYERHVALVGRELLGKHLVKVFPSTTIVGRIVEVESYGGAEDPASYVARKFKIGDRLFQQGGYSFLVHMHGHVLLNITAEKEGVPGAVLLRAVEPVRGVEIMIAISHTLGVRALCNGPGRLTKAFGVNEIDDGVDLTIASNLFICGPRKSERLSVISAPRLGVRDDGRNWRFYIDGSAFLSRRSI